MRAKLTELLKTTFNEQYEKRHMITHQHTADFLIANGVVVQEWIPVSERLPEPHENPVLAVFFGIVNPAWCYSGLWELPNNIITDKVTHWMPLPEPPKS